MALISTDYGDSQVAVQITDALMQSAKVDFSLPLTDPLVKAGAFNLWQPVSVTVYDGDTEAGGERNPAVQISGYVTQAQRNAQQLDIELHDAAIWLQRRDAVRPTALNQPVGMHVQDLFATMLDSQEHRYPAWFAPVDTTASSLWNGGDGPVVGSGSISMSAGASGVTASLRQCLATGLRFITSTNPTSVKVHLGTSASDTVTWTNTLEVSVDGGTTWLTSHAVPVNAGGADIWLDVTADTSWTSGLLAPGLVVLRLTGVASATNAGQFWNVDFVEFVLYTATSSDTAPIGAGTIDPGGPVITLPATERKTYLDWLTWLADQTGYEWAVGFDGIDWQQRIGVDADVIQNVVVSGAGTELISLEEGQYLASPVQVTIDGLALYTRVRVTASGLSDVVQTNAALAAVIGIHSTIIDLGSGATATDQANTAAQKLLELASPAMQFQATVPRTPALWGILLNGNTIIVNLFAAPVNHWQGVARIVGRAIDDNLGTMQLDLLTVQDLGSSSVPVGSGTGVTVQAPVNTRKATPKMVRRNQFVVWLNLARRLARL